ncbi:unnamed protein product [Penicillium salamii]|nr:unnamed protein product [Penicillium salamii]CAG8060102.1 unnamed protein product [Penicillium salamii]
MSEDSSTADHLCVLVHGLWGKPSHLDYVASTLKETFHDDVYILCPKANTGNYTYDGIELGGERLVHEIEETLHELAERGQKITKISMVGYSLGGLLARYAIGLLEAQGLLDKLEPMNFTTFATPHVGVRAPLKGWKDSIFNVLGARTISQSGRQMFLIDQFRDTGRSLLSVLADPDSIFIKGLKKFQRKSIYANLVNDRSVLFYTSALSKVDPFVNLANVNINYVKGYENVIVDPDTYLLPPTQRKTGTFAERVWKTCKSRIRMHENGGLFGKYRVPLLVQDVQHVVEQVFENVNASQEPAYLSNSDTEVSDSAPDKENGPSTPTPAPSGIQVEASSVRRRSSGASVHSPKLALTPEQFDIINSLNEVGLRKYPVHIHKNRHSHAAIIVRSAKDGFAEGKLVIKHWLDHEFAV